MDILLKNFIRKVKHLCSSYTGFVAMRKSRKSKASWNTLLCALIPCFINLKTVPEWNLPNFLERPSSLHFLTPMLLESDDHPIHVIYSEGKF
ncbi:hypothetical protein TNCT_234161 [Trichonephila clavata]|uniref:Uncharacterized protein n=1 Tax=Trichonephila clavata TaxID=2740835 RepID=A0A8X6FXP8_TRICU|nr:hypothetical protein TNCT_234161 [Trichonephila clavata]